MIKLNKKKFVFIIFLSLTLFIFIPSFVGSIDSNYRYATSGGTKIFAYGNSLFGATGNPTPPNNLPPAGGTYTDNSASGELNTRGDSSVITISGTASYQPLALFILKMDEAEATVTEFNWTVDAQTLTATNNTISFWVWNDDTSAWNECATDQLRQLYRNTTCQFNSSTGITPYINSTGHANFLIFSSAASADTNIDYAQFDVVYSTSTCTYSGSGNWEITDNCRLATSTYVAGSTNLRGTGSLIIPNGVELNTGELWKDSTAELFIESGGSLFDRK